jgi:hypothetical protein
LCCVVSGLLTTFSQSVLSVFTSRIFSSNFHKLAVVEIADSQAPESQPEGHLLLSGRFKSDRFFRAEQILNSDFGQMASQTRGFPSAFSQNFSPP